MVKAPVTNTVFASIFQPAESCVKENGFYLEIIPSLRSLQRERGLGENELIDIFIRCYGARLSNPGERTYFLGLDHVVNYHSSHMLR